MSKAKRIFKERFPHQAPRLKVSRTTNFSNWPERAIDADALLDRWVAGLELKFDGAIAVSGVGDGRHLCKLLEILPEGGMLFCAEKDVSRFIRFLDTNNALLLLADKRVHFGVGSLDDAFFRSLASFEVMGYSDAQPVIFAPLFNEAEDYYSKFFLEFVRQLEMWRKMYGTNLTQSGLWQGNALANLQNLVSSPDPIDFQGFFEGVPLIMAGAGPSLDESLEFLRWAQDRAVIVAGNSSIRALRHGGVEPHFVLAADPNETTDAGFEGVDLGRTVLFCPFMVYPKVADRFVGRVSAWSFGSALATYFRKLCGRQRSAFVVEQGTVSACAFDLAVIFGSPAVFFVGQDLCARTDGKLHAQDSFYSDLGHDGADLDKCRWLPGNTIEKVPVEGKLYVYLKTFEELAVAYTSGLREKGARGLALYNLSRLGARVEGMPYLDLDKAKRVLDSHRSGNCSRGWQRVEEVLSQARMGWEKAEPALRELRGYAEKICSFALQRALALENGTMTEVEANEAGEELERLIEAEEEFAALLKDGQLKMELHVHRRAKSLMARAGKGSAIENLKSHFWAIAEGSFQFLKAIDRGLGEDAANEIQAGSSS